MSRTDEWKDDGRYMHCSAFKHGTYGYVTVDFDTRRATCGLVMPRSHNTLVNPNDYKGRGWRDRLLEDAFRASEKLWAGDTTG